jgi:hypothetical protein
MDRVRDRVRVVVRDRVRERSMMKRVIVYKRRDDI